MTETIFFQKSVKLFAFDFGTSDSGRDIGYDISQRMWPSLAIAVPVLLVGLAVNISLCALHRACSGPPMWTWAAWCCWWP